MTEQVQLNSGGKTPFIEYLHLSSGKFMDAVFYDLIGGRLNNLFMQVGERKFTFDVNYHKVNISVQIQNLVY